MPPEQPDGRALFEAAAAAYDAGDIAGARANLLELIEHSPNDSRALSGLATLASEQGEHKQAVAYYGRMLETGRSAEILIARSQALAKTGKLDEALVDASEAVQLAPDASQGYVQRAGILRQQGELVQARAQLEEALARDAKDFSAGIGLASLLAKMGKQREAIEQCTRLIGLRADAPVPYGIRGDSRRAIGELDEALADYAKVSELVAQDALSFYLRGEIYRQKGDLPKALEMYREAMARAPEDPDSHNGAGLVLESQQEFHAALEHYNRVVELAPQWATGYANRGDVYMRLSQFEEAIASFSEAIRLAPKQFYPYLRLGDAYLETRQPDKALENYQQVCTLAPSLAVGFRCSGDLYREQGETEKALAAYTRALELDPQDPNAHNGMGLLKRDQEKYEESLAHFRKVIELAPESPVGYANCADVYDDQEQFRPAIDYYTEAIKRQPAPSNAYLYAARGKAEIGNEGWEQALLDFDRALELDPRNADAHFGRGRVFESQSTYSEAISEYDRGIELAPENAMGYYYRGQVRKRRGDNLAALADFQKLVQLLPSSPDAHSYIGSVLFSLRGYDRAVEAFGAAFESRNSAQSLVDMADSLRVWGLELDEPDKLRRAVETAEKALKLEESNAVAYAILGSAKARLTGEYDAGVQALRRAFEIDSQYYWALWELGRVHYHAGNCAAAETTFRNLGELDQNSITQSKLGRALALRRQGKIAEGDSIFQSIVDSATDQAAAYLERGLLLLELREWQAAVDDFRRAVGTNAQLIEAQNGLAWYQAEELGINFDECLVAAQRAVELAGQDPTIRGNVIDTLGWVHYKRGELDAAKQYVEQAVKLKEPDLEIRTHMAILSDTARAAV
jgi:tetratricopeptide (TPR) repeat protein